MMMLSKEEFEAETDAERLKLWTAAMNCGA
jgi:hypothetical protein